VGVNRSAGILAVNGSRFGGYFAVLELLITSLAVSRDGTMVVEGAILSVIILMGLRAGGKRLSAGI
jgi:hypothetical protein